MGGQKKHQIKNSSQSASASLPHRALSSGAHFKCSQHTWVKLFWDVLGCLGHKFHWGTWAGNSNSSQAQCNWMMVGDQATSKGGNTPAANEEEGSEMTASVKRKNRLIKRWQLWHLLSQWDLNYDPHPGTIVPALRSVVAGERNKSSSCPSQPTWTEVAW